ncbi:toll/interleukin-1 receptor domain-containing protein [Longimicrobium sp.]|uniref:toll/interleukin-1 receptor domain-containing protein n=1 Tax=Longimicrobium sp. TaxID=2029185 RepID=UPI003B3B40C0
MATIFISYKNEDRALATRLAELLRAAGHTIRVDTDAVLVGSSWRDALMRALMESDALVVLLTPAALQSQFVLAEVGAARAFSQTERKMGLFPVVLGDMEILPFIQDLFVFRLRDVDEESLRVAAADLDTAVREHVLQREATRGPLLFISHRHKDEAIARALVETLQAAFELDPADIRCTSVRPYRLPVGERTAERLRAELRGTGAVLGIIAPDTLESSYVLFELGAAWSNGILTCPLLVRGATHVNIPDPIRDLSPLSLSSGGDCQQLLDDLEDVLKLKPKAVTRGALHDRIDALVRAAAALVA